MFICGSLYCPRAPSPSPLLWPLHSDTLVNLQLRATFGTHVPCKDAAQDAEAAGTNLYSEPASCIGQPQNCNQMDKKTRGGPRRLECQRCQCGSFECHFLFLCLKDMSERVPKFTASHTARQA